MDAKHMPLVAYADALSRCPSHMDVNTGVDIFLVLVSWLYGFVKSCCIRVMGIKGFSISAHAYSIGCL